MISKVQDAVREGKISPREGAELLELRARLRQWRPRTWMVELAVVAVVLFAVAIATGGSWVELLGATAVLGSFAHAQVADRLAEAENERRAYVKIEAFDTIGVRCHRWATRYLVGKEALWCVYFILHGSWSALAGVGLFLCYPVWRRFYRARRPLERS